MRYRYVTADVFTSRPLEGNPLAVFPDARGVPEHLLQRIARELNLSETTFVLPPREPRHTRVPGGGQAQWRDHRRRRFLGLDCRSDHGDPRRL